MFQSCYTPAFRCQACENSPERRHACRPTWLLAGGAPGQGELPGISWINPPPGRGDLCPVKDAPRQLQQRQRIAPRLRHDTVPHPFIQRPADHRAEQLPRSTLTQTPDQQLRQPPELLTRLTGGDHQRDRLGQQSARHERQHQRRFPVQPMRVIDHAQKGLLLSYL